MQVPRMSRIEGNNSVQATLFQPRLPSVAREIHRGLHAAGQAVPRKGGRVTFTIGNINPEEWTVEHDQCGCVSAAIRDPEARLSIGHFLWRCAEHEL